MLEINKVHLGDCLELLKQIPDNYVSAIVTDPPAGIAFMGKDWDKNKGGRDEWIAWMQEVASECLRVIKPGGHALVWAIPRTAHWTTTAWENAGFEVRDVLSHIFASGFPKSHNIGKSVEKQKVGGIKNLKIIGSKKGIKVETGTQGFSYNKEYVAGKCMGGKQIQGQIPVYDINNEWEGRGTALKPAREDWILLRKPLSEKTIVENVLKWGTGAIDIDGCRIPTTQKDRESMYRENTVRDSSNSTTFKNINKYSNPDEAGRFPANILCTDDALNDGVIQKSDSGKSNTYEKYGGQWGQGKQIRNEGFGDSGSKSRYFDIDVRAEKYGLLQFPKASKSERNKGMSEGQSNTHPTIKNVHLMAYLVKLISKPGDIVLEPFAGSGTTCVACKMLGRNFIAMELTEEYIPICEARINAAEKIVEEPKEKHLF